MDGNGASLEYEASNVKVRVEGQKGDSDAGICFTKGLH
jgi:hypothetical protein